MKIGVLFILGALSLASARGDSIVKSTYSGTKGLNDLAKAAGRYMGTATDIGELSDPYYVKQLKNISEFGMITPANAMKVRYQIAVSCAWSSSNAVVSVCSGMLPSRRKTPSRTPKATRSWLLRRLRAPKSAATLLSG
jgi:hypothetical protein